MLSKEEIKLGLEKGIGEVIFTKNDGTERVMKCTLNPLFLPAITETTETKSKRVKTDNPDTLAVWDVDNSGWRSFRVDSVLSTKFCI